MEAAGIRPEEYCHKEFFSNDRTCDLPGALALLKQYGERFENIIVVIHLEMARDLPTEFGLRVLGVDDFPSFAFFHGEGCVIDCEKRTCVPFDY